MASCLAEVRDNRSSLCVVVQANGVPLEGANIIVYHVPDLPWEDTEPTRLASEALELGEGIADAAGCWRMESVPADGTLYIVVAKSGFAGRQVMIEAGKVTSDVAVDLDKREEHFGFARAFAHGQIPYSIVYGPERGIWHQQVIEEADGGIYPRWPIDLGVRYIGVVFSGRLMQIVDLDRSGLMGNAGSASSYAPVVEPHVIVSVPDDAVAPGVSLSARTRTRSLSSCIPMDSWLAFSGWTPVAVGERAAITCGLCGEGGTTLDLKFEPGGAMYCIKEDQAEYKLMYQGIGLVEIHTSKERWEKMQLSPEDRIMIRGIQGHPAVAIFLAHMMTSEAIGPFALPFGEYELVAMPEPDQESNVQPRQLSSLELSSIEMTWEL